MPRKQIYLKRIISDIAEISSDYDPKIHIAYDESNITNISALIIGPDDTPYKDGFFFFTLKFTDKYPMKCPSAKFETISPQIRFNPNLYEEGKVCLSILNTWSGPGWSPIQTIKSTLLSIQSLLHENPIINEPGFEDVKIDEDRAFQYNEYIRYHTYNFAVYEMLSNKKQFPYFNDVIESYFIRNYEKIINNLEKYKHLDGKIMKTFIWNHSIQIDYKQLIEKFKSLYEKLKDNEYKKQDTSVHNFTVKKQLNINI